MKKLLFSVTLLSFLNIQAQEPVLHWAKNSGGTAYDMGRDIAIDAQGNVYTVGSFNSTFDFDPGPGVSMLTGMGNNDGFIQKYDGNGNFLWAKQISGNLIESVSEIALDASGNIYVAGEYSATVDFNPGPAVFPMTSTTSVGNTKSIDIYIAKLDTNGNFVWAKSFGGSGYDGLRDMRLDANGNIILAGYFSATVDFNPGAGTFPMAAGGTDDIFFSKLDADGNFIWAKRIGDTNNDRLNAMAIDASGNIYGTGYFYGQVDFDPNAGLAILQPSAPDPQNGVLSDAFILKLTSAGNLAWAKKIGGTGFEEGKTIAVDGSGNVMTSGYFYHTVDFDPGAGEQFLTSPLASSMYISKLTSDGDFAWAKLVPSSNATYPYAMQADPDGTFYIAGGFQFTASFGENLSVTSVSSSAEDIYITKYNPEGNALWVKAFGSTGDDNITAFKATSDGSIYATGGFDATIDMDSGDGTFNLVSAGANDIFVQRLSPESLSVPETGMATGIVYANPSKGIVNAAVPAHWIGARITAYNMTGQKIQSFILDAAMVQLHFPPGVFLLEAANNQGRTVTKLAVE